uniref:Variant surface glycoprotein n=1 Tax=Trypanosoma brucei TaxID=5691 RepID=A0A1V0FYK4_9TRYP|nr:variant surface glycoprotein [Trypanosoma brucei]
MFFLLHLTAAIAATTTVLAANEHAIGPKMTAAVCDTAALFREKLNAAISTAVAAKTHATDSARNILRLKILAARNKDPSTKRQLLPILIAAESNYYTEQATDVPENGVKRVQAAKYSAYVLGNIDEYLRIAGHAAASGTAGCFATGDLSAAGAGHVKYSELKTANPNCQAADLEENPTLDTQNKFKPGGLEPVGGTPTDKSTSVAGCKLHAAGGSNGHIDNGAASNQHMLLAGGLFKIGSSTIEAQTLTNLRAAEATPGLTTIAKAFNADQPGANQQRQALPTTPEDAAQSHAFVTALTRLVNAPNQLSGAELTTQLKALYGKPDQDLKEKLWQKMSSIKAPTDHSSTDKGKTLPEITDISLLTEMLSNATIDAATQVEQTTTCKNQSKELDDDKNGDEANEKICEKFHDKPKECPDKACTYDTKTNKCNAKVVAGTETAATGEKPKDGAASTGCAKHGTDKNACLAEKKDDKPVCAFRTGKDNEPEKEKEMCRDGSFLLNKKFALSVVSAAFVALLF